MTGHELFEKLKPTFLRVGPNEKTEELYAEISASLNEFNIIDTFFQLKKNEKGQGLALEVMLFDDDLIHDIVITQTTTEHITVLTKNVNVCSIETNFGISTNDKGEKTETDLLHFRISYGVALNVLVYKTDIKRFSELVKIKSNLLRAIIK